MNQRRENQFERLCDTCADQSKPVQEKAVERLQAEIR